MAASGVSVLAVALDWRFYRLGTADAAWASMNASRSLP